MSHNLPDPASELEFEQNYLNLVNAIHSASSPNAIMVGLRDQILDVYQVEMATIFLVARLPKKQLVSWLVLPGEFLKKIYLPIDHSSIAGYVAVTGEVLSIADAYDQEELRSINPALRFNAIWDEQTNVRTREVLAAPIVYRNSLLGVVELINTRHERGFSERDLQRILNLAETLAIALYNNLRMSHKVPLKFDCLVKKRLISAQELDRALAIAAQEKVEPETILIQNFRIAKSDLGEALASFYNTRYVDLSQIDYYPKQLFKGINIDYFRAASLAPLSLTDNTVVVAAMDPEEQSTLIHEVRQVLRVAKAEVLFAFRDEIEAFWKRIKSTYYPDEATSFLSPKKSSFASIIERIEVEEKISSSLLAKDSSAKEEVIDDRPVVLLVEQIIEKAYYRNASDIHIEPYGTEHDAEVRYRIDGDCTDVLKIPKNYVRRVIARFKILAELNIAERRKPQDGKIKFTTSRGKEIELRVATIPTANSNEDIVLRVLADSKPLPLQDILPPRILEAFQEIIVKPYGIVLVVGPTGSGKTTTLHSVLSAINTPQKKIWTAEDPVEITQYRLRQVQVKPMIGFTFAAAMRAFLRADPDVIMIGEMRDEETAKMAMEASLTGHLVFSTLHTNSAPETIVRLLDMGIDTFNFADSLLGVLAQRLVRTLCDKCKEPYHPDREEYDHLFHNYGVLFFDHINILYSDKLTLYRAKGCPACNNSGYRGRQGIYELMVSSPRLKKLIIKRAAASDLKEEAISNGMTVLLQEGIHLIFDGKTDYKQVMSVCFQ